MSEDEFVGIGTFCD